MPASTVLIHGDSSSFKWMSEPDFLCSVFCCKMLHP
uniref:Uncharacterized protein n=1 Tax=Anguilla anguilla TaxID=7936 RepID=A0A0E9TSB8_ANGAN